MGERVRDAFSRQRRRAVVESRPIDRHQIDRSPKRALARPQASDRHLEADTSVRRLASNRRWELSYGGERSDSHRWLRFR